MTNNIDNFSTCFLAKAFAFFAKDRLGDIPKNAWFLHCFDIMGWA